MHQSLPPLIQFDPQSIGVAIPSPCIGICRLHPASGLCDGCQRSMDEIISWASIGDDGQRIIWQQINQHRRLKDLP